MAMSLAEVAQWLGVSEDDVLRLAAEHGFPLYGTSSGLEVSQADIDVWAARQIARKVVKDGESNRR